MNIAIVGAGAVGHVAAMEAIKTTYVKKLVVADISPQAAENLAQKLRGKTTADIVMARVDASDTESVAAILSDIDVLVHAGIPQYNFTVMEACICTKTNYIDMAADSPTWLLKQLEWDDRFKAAGILGIMGLGCDPGFTNIAARYAVDQLDTVKSITVLDGDKSMVDYEGFCAYFSPQTAIKECLAKPNYWSKEEGMQFDAKPFTRQDEYEFPEPIGWLDCYRVEHEEVATLGETIGRAKGCELVEFMYALHPDYVNTLKVLSYLGLDGDEPIKVDGTDVIPLHVVVTSMPKPQDLAGKIHGFSCIGTVVKGMKDGELVELFVYSMVNHDEVYLRMNTQATVFQTGVPPIVAIDMMAEGLLNQTGCIPPEMIDPIPFLARLETRGMKWYVSKKTTPVYERIEA